MLSSSSGGSAECRRHGPNALCDKCVLHKTFNAPDQQSNKIGSNSTNKSSGSTTPSPPMPIDPAKLPVQLYSPQKRLDSVESSSSISTPRRLTSPEPPVNSVPAGVPLRNLDADEETGTTEAEQRRVDQVAGCRSSLQRLFESGVFDVALCVQYISRTKEPGIISYLGNRLFQFEPHSVDFYLPQLIALHVAFADVADALHAYLLHRSSTDASFALRALWLLEAFGVLRLGGERDWGSAKGATLLADILNATGASRRPSRSASVAVTQEPQRESSSSAVELTDKSVIEAAVAKDQAAAAAAATTSSVTRCESAAIFEVRDANPTPRPLVRAFDSGCTCPPLGGGKTPNENGRNLCTCPVDRLRGQKELMRALMRIGHWLRAFPSKEERTRCLERELSVLNASLPANVWLPIDATSACGEERSLDHHVLLRIAPTAGCVLNSKERSPYCIYVEVLETAVEPLRAQLPPRQPDFPADLFLLASGAAMRGDLFATKIEAQKTEDHEKKEEVEEEDVDEAVSEPPVGDLEASSSSHHAASIAGTIAHIKSAEVAAANMGAKGRALGRKLSLWVQRKRHRMRHTPDDPSAWALSEPWEEKEGRLRAASPYGRLPGWRLVPLIVKAGDDLRIELLAYQMLTALKDIWTEEKVPLRLYPYRIVVVSHDSGLIEPVVDSCSIHQIKKNQTQSGTPPSLHRHFVDVYGDPDSEAFLAAQQNFVESCAAYSLATYILQVKDRHNGNILIDSLGHMVHIDFGFMLCTSPRGLGFEQAPFKLTTEMVELMDGAGSTCFAYYKQLILLGLLAVRRHHERVLVLANIMAASGCIEALRTTTTQGLSAALQSRLHLGGTEKELMTVVDGLVEQSRDALTTRLYDNYQYYTNGIL